MDHRPTVKLKDVVIANPEYSPGFAKFVVIFACIMEGLVMLGVL